MREQYRNAAAKIFPDDSFLMRFYKNVIGEDGGELNRMEMICARLFEDPTLLRNVDPKDALCKRKGEGRRIDSRSVHEHKEGLFMRKSLNAHKAPATLECTFT